MTWQTRTGCGTAHYSISENALRGPPGLICVNLECQLLYFSPADPQRKIFGLPEN
jgi:hypothetical protein